MESAGNDGYNALTLDKDIKAKRAFVISFRMMAAYANAVSPKDIPEEWFDWTYEPGDSALASSLGVQRLAFLIIKERFSEGYALAVKLETEVTSLANTYRLVVSTEKLFCMMMLAHDKREIKDAYESSKKAFHLLSKIPSTMRTLYVYYKLVEADENKAQRAKLDFEKIAKKYPYPAEIAMERELMALAQKNEKVPL